MSYPYHPSSSRHSGSSRGGREFNIINHQSYSSSGHSQSSYHQPTYSSQHYGRDAYGSDYDHRTSRGQTQAQGQVFRSAQASKQMVYEVFGNTITMMEEMEQRELRKQGKKGSSLSRSDIELPSQSEHDDKTIKRKLETQLLLFQSQMDSCDREIKDDVKRDLKEKTLQWNSQREAKIVKRSETDKYVGKLYEVLAKGKTEHPEDFYKAPTISERGMQRAMGAYMTGNQRRSDLDSSFRNDPSRQAAAPRIREGAGLELGAERLAQDRPDLKSSLDYYRGYDMK